MAEKTGTALSSIEGFPAEAIRRLDRLWITTAEELTGASQAEGGLAGLAAVLDLPGEEVDRLVNLALAALPAERSPLGDIQRHGLGALDEPEEVTGPATPRSTTPLPGSIDLRARFGLVRDQGQRGTCVAHACTAVREYLTGAASPQANLSEQFLYWDCKQHDLVAGAGTFIRTAMHRLQVDGIPLEGDWPYNPTPIAGNEGQDPPPAGILEKAAPYRTLLSTQLPPKEVDALRQALAEQGPVAFAVPVYTHWFMEPTRTTGDVRLPLPGEKVEGGHAMCMVGYQADPDVPGGGWFLVRNSWGESWARGSAVAAGYARIPFAYLQEYGTSAYTASAGEPVKSFWARILEWILRLLQGAKAEPA